MTKITGLTQEQKNQFGPWVKKWVEIGLSTEPADFDRAENAALKAYTMAGLQRPMVVLRFGSPYAATVGGGIAWTMLHRLFGAQVGAQVGDQVWDQVGAQVWDQVRAQVRAQVGAQVWEIVREGLDNDGISALWCSFTAFATFFRDQCGWGDTKILEKLKINEDLVSSVGWTWWNKSILALSDRPKSIRRDDRGSLHFANGPSIEYRDGWALYHWHGQAVPEEWITKPGFLTAKIALEQENMDLRAAACEMLGWDKIIDELGGKTIDKDEDEYVGELLSVDLPDSPSTLFLRARCGTGRMVVISVVDKKCKTALEANLGSYGLPIDRSFLPEART